MFNVQGKNVVIVGGLNGVGLSLTKTILTKRCNVSTKCTFQRSLFS